MSWEPVAGAAFYRLQLSPSADHAGGQPWDTKSTSFVLPIIPPESAAGTIYSWQVIACPSTGCPDWTPATAELRTFSKAVRSVVPETPSNGAEVGGDVRLSWGGLVPSAPAAGQPWPIATQPAGFIVQVDADPAFGSPSEVARPLGSHATIAGLDAGTTYWRVQQLDGGGFSSPSSFAYDFGPTTATAPVNGSVVQVPAILRWTPVAGAASWEVTVTNALGNRTDDGGYQTAAAPPGGRLLPGTVSWRVRPLTADSHSGTWASGSFTVPQHQVGLTSPASGATIPTIGTEFTWTDVGDPTDWFVFESSTSPSFSTLIESEPIEGHRWIASAAYPVGVVYLRVRAMNSSTETGQSSVGQSSVQTGSSVVRVATVAPPPDTNAPTGSISIAGGAAYTTNSATTLSVPATDLESGISQVALSNDGATWTTRAYATTQSWTLPTGDGTKTVYAKWRDGAGNWSAPKTDTIVLDTTPPSGSVSINAGAAYATSTAVTVSVSASDRGSGVSQVALSNDGATWTTGTYGATQAWTVSGGDGTKTVYAKWRDGAGNWSAPKSDTIVLDTLAPTAGAPANAFAAGSIVNSSLTPTKLTWSGSDATSGIARYELAQSTDGGAWTTVSTSLTTATTTRSLAKSHTYRFRVRAIDRAGNVGGWAYGTTFRVSAYQETSTAIHYHGTWHTGSTTAYWGGHDRYTTATGAYATFTFTGRSFAWVNATSVSRGSAKVYVNGIYVATVNLHASSATYRKVVFAKSWSTSARRTITIKCVGTSGHPRIDIDALVTGS
jgi:hypothetical protein